MLPNPADAGAYFAEVYALPLSHWRAALSEIAARHGFADGPWERARLGRNVVFLGPEVAIKLGPPFWAGDMPREAAALSFVAGRLPVPTPDALGVGRLEGWEYLAVSRLSGEHLYERWSELSAAERVALAFQHGELMASLHALPVQAAPAALQRDWRPVIAGQRADLIANLEHSGLAPALIEQAATYIDAAMPRLLADADQRLIHGDLSHFNLLVEREGAGWRIVALIDWGDTNLGPRGHELISPAMHMYRGEAAALAAWYRGYGLGPVLEPALAHEATARAVLAYADELGAMLERVGAAGCAHWPAVERRLWGVVE